MAVSNDISFTVTRDEIITEALEQLGVLGEGDAPNSEQLTSSSRTLNMMTKAWQADGLNLFAVQTLYLFMQEGVESFTLDANTSNKFTASFVETTIMNAALQGAFTVDVNSIEGILDGDQIGIAYGNSVQWTTVNGTPVGNTIIITDALVSDIEESAVVYAYTTTANRPMKIMEGYVHIGSSDTDIPIGHVSRTRYNRLSVKSSVGLPTQFYYDPQIAAGNLFVWPTAIDEKDYLVLFAQKTLSDMTSDSDNPEYPQEWYLPMALNLALLLAPKYGTPNDAYSKIRMQAEKWYDAARGFDDELYTSVYFTHDMRGEEL